MGNKASSQNFKLGKIYYQNNHASSLNNNDSLNWNDVNSSSVSLTDDNLISLSIPDLTESDLDSISNLSPSLVNKLTSNIDQKTDFIKKLTENSVQNSNLSTESSPFINSDIYNKIMEGGNLDDSSSSSSKSSSSSTFLEDNSSSTSDLDSMIKLVNQQRKSSKKKSKKKTSKKIKKSNKKKSKKRRGKLHTTTESISLSETSNASDQNMYGFSSTSSELINTKSISNFSNSNFNNDLNSNSTPYKLSSDTLNTSDINLVSVDQTN
jgi:hypothetical protein